MLDLGRTLLYVVEREPAVPAIVARGSSLTCAGWLDRVLRAAVAGLPDERLGQKVTALMRRSISRASVPSTTPTPPRIPGRPRSA